MKKILILVALMAIVATGVQAEETTPTSKKQGMPARRDLMISTQPDGYQLRTFKRGDERMHWSMTEDGWQIVSTKKGWFKYAKMNSKGKVVAHWRKARNAEDRSKYAKRWLDKHGIKKVVA
jgi:hypothetical protein